MACIMKMTTHNLQNSIGKLHVVFCFNNGGQCNLNKIPIEIFKVPKFSLNQTCHKP